METLAQNDPEFRIWYEDRQVWHRANAYLVEAWTVTMGRAETELDSLFEAAMALDADNA